MKRISFLLLNALPIILMIALIPFVPDDYALTGIFVVIIAVALAIHRQKSDLPLLVWGFFIMIACEYLFVSTGVETFVRHTLLGIMPFWLPFLWSYGFVAIKRLIRMIS